MVSTFRNEWTFRAGKGFFFVILAIMAVSAQASPSTFQFDIICNNHGRKVIDHEADMNQSPGDNAPWVWHDSFRYAIDLKSKRYRGLEWVDQSPVKIARVTKTRLWFSEDQNGFERYNLISNRYYARGHGETFLIHTVTGRCRRADYSGMVAKPRPVPRR
jgi:hypothetical protein